MILFAEIKQRYCIVLKKDYYTVIFIFVKIIYIGSENYGLSQIKFEGFHEAPQPVEQEESAP